MDSERNASVRLDRERTEGDALATGREGIGPGRRDCREGVTSKAFPLGNPKPLPAKELWQAYPADRDPHPRPPRRGGGIMSYPPLDFFTPLGVRFFPA